MSGGYEYVPRRALRGTEIPVCPLTLSSQSSTMICAESLRLHPTLCDPLDCSPSGFSVLGILQARTLEWIAMPFYNGLDRD